MLLELHLYLILIEVFTVSTFVSRSALLSLKHMRVGLLVASRECSFYIFGRCSEHVVSVTIYTTLDNFFSPNAVPTHLYIKWSVSP